MNSSNSQPISVRTAYKKGIELKTIGNFHEAEKFFRTLLENHPHDPDAQLHLGNTLVAAGRLEEGIAELNKNLFRHPQHTLSAYNLGYALFLAQHFQEALMAFNLALSLKPDLIDARINRACTFHALGLLEQALIDFDQALLQAPDLADTHWNRALTLLTMGNYSQGWKEYEWRWQRDLRKRTYPHQFRQPLWDGEPFSEKRLLVYSEQGFGDTIQFARFLPQVKALGGTIIFEARKELASLCKTLDGIDELVTFSHKTPRSEGFELCIPLMSLPHRLNITLDNLPPPATLTIDLEKQQYWRRRINKNKTNIGVVWAGQTTHVNDQHRSMPLNALTCLSTLNNIDLYSLQTGSAGQQTGEFTSPEIIRDCAPQLHDFSDTAALINELDLVISVDTAVAHLAASLGKPTFILLSYVPDWRWQRGLKKTPWYPSVTLFRQTSPGNWSDLSQQLLQTLQTIF